MKRIIIICEGQTEQAFCKRVLYDYFDFKNILLQYPTIKKSKGGIVGWADLKKQIETHLKQEPTVFVTTLIDFYGIYEHHNFPNWAEAAKIVDKNARMDCLEVGMKVDIAAKIRHRYIPYIQLHEFEGLLFNNLQVFQKEIPAEDLKDKATLMHIFENFPNPELINNTPDNAPSKRLDRLIDGYNKIVHGSILAESIGLQQIRNKCPRFNQWILNLEKIA
jgi:hypothetical protein